MKDNWIFQNIKVNVNALPLNFWQTYVQCYELNKVMQQFDMVFIQTLYKFHIPTENTKDVEFINSIYNQQLLFRIYFIQKKLMQKHNENVFTNTLRPSFIFKTMDINHQSCPPSYKLSNDLSKTMGLHFTINI
jgi:hypothetical protein